MFQEIKDPPKTKTRTTIELELRTDQRRRIEPEQVLELNPKTRTTKATTIPKLSQAQYLSLSTPIASPKNSTFCAM